MFSSVLGTIALVFYTFPYLGIIYLPMAVLYYIISIYYRRSSVETKRLDSLLRSTLYGSYSGNIFLPLIPDLLTECTPILETLTGLSTIRAYREQASRFMVDFNFVSNMAQNRCVKDAEHGLDMENRAYLMTIVMQRWLAMRLDLLGNILVLGIALFGVAFRTTINPAKIGVVLSYALASKFIHNFMVCLLIVFYFKVAQVFCE